MLLLANPENSPTLEQELRSADKRRWPWLVVIALFATAGLFVVGIGRPETDTKKKVAETVEAPTIPVTIVGQSAIVVDLNSGEVLYEKNADQVSAPASLTKLLTALVASKYLPGDTEITISYQAIQEQGDSGLEIGEVWRLNDLISYTLVNSSNDGAAAIAEALEIETGQSFVGLMNNEAVTLGMASSIFANPTGLDFDSHGDGVFSRTTARDITKMVKNLFQTRPEIFAPTTAMSYQVKSGERWRSALNTNHEVRRWPGLLGSKTGYTDAAGGNLATIFDAGINQPVVIVVLGSTIDGRFSDTETLISFARQKIADPRVTAI